MDGRSSAESDIETRSCSSYRQSTPQQQQQQQNSMEHENSIGIFIDVLFWGLFFPRSFDR